MDGWFVLKIIIVGLFHKGILWEHQHVGQRDFQGRDLCFSILYVEQKVPNCRWFLGEFYKDVWDTIGHDLYSLASKVLGTS